MRRLARIGGIALIAAGILWFAAVALAGPWGILRDLRQPCLALAAGYLLASFGQRAWFARERLLSLLSHRSFPAVLTLAAAVVFVRVKLLHWWAGEVSGLDFSHIDYAIWSTLHGRFMAIPILPPQATFTDFFGNHYSPVLFFWVALRALWDSPVASLTLHALALAAAVPALYALARQRTEPAVASLLALTYVFCGAVAGTLQFDIHQEAFYPLAFGLLFLGLAGSRAWMIVGTLLALSVKEDAGVYLVPLFAWLALRYPARRRLSIALLVGSAAYLVFALKVGMPAHQPAAGTAPYYLPMWAKYGGSFREVFVGMLTHPLWVLADIFLNPGLYKNLLPWGGLPLISPLAPIVVAPIVVASTAAGAQHSFGLYYGIVLVPLFFAATVEAFRRYRLSVRAAAILLALSALVGGSFLRFPAPSPAFPEWRAAGAAIRATVGEEKVVWVQSGLLPYLPYETKWRRLDDLAALPPPGQAAVVLDSGLSHAPLAEPEDVLSGRLLAHGYHERSHVGSLRIFE